jgi:DNA-directed RNA polymerase specialized sigma24 family protein
MRTILDILSDNHKIWVKYVISFGCDPEIAEDYVQEMYLKIYSYSERNDNDLMYNENEINYFFIYVTLKNMYYDNNRKNSKVILVDFEKIEIPEEEYSEMKFNEQMNKVKSWELQINDEIKNIKTYTRSKANLCYIKFIYDKIFIENMSITDLSNEVGISYWSLRNTIQIIKQQIKNEI